VRPTPSAKRVSPVNKIGGVRSLRFGIPKLVMTGGMRSLDFARDDVRSGMTEERQIDPGVWPGVCMTLRKDSPKVMV